MQSGKIWLLCMVSLPLIELAMELMVEWLNLRQFRKPVSDSIQEWYDPDRHDRAYHYQWAHLKFDVLERITFLGLGFLFFFSHLGASWDHWLSDRISSEIIRGVLFSESLLAVVFIISTFYAYLRVFRVEERFGFNRTSYRTFWLDRLKIGLLGGVVGGALIMGLLAIESRTSSPYFYGFAITSGFSLILNWIAPVLLLPLFFRLRPIENESLRRRMMEYIQRHGLHIRGIYEMDGSRRSSKANAFFIGIGPYKRVVLFDTLLDQLPEEEALAVLAHETGHYREGHLYVHLLMGILHWAILFAGMHFLIHSPALFQALGFNRPSFYVGLWLLPFFYIPANLILQILFNAISRHLEFRADRFAAHTLPDGARTLENALMRLYRNSLQNLQPHVLKVWLEYSHPPLTERIGRLRNLQKESEIP